MPLIMQFKSSSSHMEVFPHKFPNGPIYLPSPKPLFLGLGGGRISSLKGIPQNLIRVNFPYILAANISMLLKKVQLI